MYSEQEENRFLEVTYAGGDKEILYFKDFNSGAMIQNVVDRAKKLAIKDFHQRRGNAAYGSSICCPRCVDEFKENEDLPNTTNPDDWARISAEGRADHLCPHAGLDEVRHRAWPHHRHGLQHRAVPLS